MFDKDGQRALRNRAIANEQDLIFKGQHVEKFDSQLCSKLFCETSNYCILAFFADQGAHTAVETDGQDVLRRRFAGCAKVGEMGGDGFKRGMGLLDAAGQGSVGEAASAPKSIMFPLHTGQPISPGRRDAFAALALVYLLLPSLVFLLTWIQPGIGVPVAIVTALSCLWFLRRNFRCEARRGLSGTDWFCILVLAGAWTWLAGIGGWAPQVSDYEKHNLVFHDLLQQSWPVTYQTGGEGNFLCYGMGYYLAPAWLARALGVGWLPTATFVWGWAGVALFFYWVATFGGLAKKGLIVFLCFATTETLWHMFLHLLHAGPLGSVGHGIDSALDHMGIRADYSDTLMSLQYRPQHVISAWLGCALFYELFWVRRSARGAALVWAACVFWSPLMSLGLLLIPVVALGRWR